MEGDEVFFIEEGKDKWSGLAKVTGQEGLKVRIIHAGYDRTLPACRVIPRYPEKVIGEEISENSQGMENDGMESQLKSTQGMEAVENIQTQEKLDFFYVLFNSLIF